MKQAKEGRTKRTPYIIVKVKQEPNWSISLERKVNQAILSGYVPVGGLSVWADNLYGKCMAQAMVLK